MIYHQIDSSEGLVKIGRLDVDQSQLRAVFVQIFIGDPIDLDIQEVDHRKIFGRVTSPKVTIGVVIRLRPKSSRKASALPRASGSGSCWSKM